jgi:hypothetical protein
VNCGLRIADCGLNTESGRNRPAYCLAPPPPAFRSPVAQNKPNLKRSFKLEVSSVKTGKEWYGLPTSHSAEGQLREIPHYSSILSFHHSAPNKPNLRTGRRKDKCRVDKEL